MKYSDQGRMLIHDYLNPYYGHDLIYIKRPGVRGWLKADILSEYSWVENNNVTLNEPIRREFPGGEFVQAGTLDRYLTDDHFKVEVVLLAQGKDNPDDVHFWFYFNDEYYTEVSGTAILCKKVTTPKGKVLYHGLPAFMYNPIVKAFEVLQVEYRPESLFHFETYLEYVKHAIAVDK